METASWKAGELLHRLYVVVRRNEDESVREAEKAAMEDAIRSYVESGT